MPIHYEKHIIYQYDKKVVLNNRIETSIVFNNLYKQFFDKLYFGDLFENGCYFKNLQRGEGDYCGKGKKSQIENLAKLGINIRRLYILFYFKFFI